MAKTESTAVNDLIKIASTQSPLSKDPSEDLMFTIPPKKDRSSKHAIAPRGNDIAPLPRDRAPHGTQEHAVARRAISIPLLPATPVPISTSRASGASVEPIATRATRPSLPPPTRAPLPPPSRAAMPSEYPIVSEVHRAPMAPAPQPELDDEEAPWADDSMDVDVAPFHGDSTAQVAKQRTNLEWMIKLAPVAGLMIVLGVLIGGYLVLDGQGGEQRSAAAPVGTVEVRVVEAAVATPNVAAPVETATAVMPSTATPAAAAVPATPAIATAAPPTAPASPPTAPASSPTMDVPPPTPSITAPAPTAAAIARRPVFIDVRIDSQPSGATVMLVDRGKQTFLGTTPISTAVDPARVYEIVFSHPRRQTQIERLDPKATSRLAVVLGKPGNRATPELAKAAIHTAGPAVVAKVEPVTKPVTAVKAKIAKSAKIIEPAWDTQVEKAAKPEPKTEVRAPKIETAEPAKIESETAAKAEKAAGGNGVLMISSKPPCEIHVDGKSTGLMTPQRALSLSAGKHKITLVNPAQKIKKSIAVEITANASTKVIQDLTELMK